jgi:endonuclease YncB( thermonuclease family)
LNSQREKEAQLKSEWNRAMMSAVGFGLRMLAAALVLILLPSLGGADDTTLIGQVTFVRDGDTIEVSGVAIRLNGVSAPEQRQPYGPDATAFMGWLVMEKEVTCKLNGERNRDRLIGICYLDGADIGETIIREGLARDCPRYSDGRYAEAEKEAKRTGIHERYELPDYCRPKGLRS